MKERASRPEERGAATRSGGARGESAPPQRSPAPTSVQQAPRHRAAFLSTADLVRRVAPRRRAPREALLVVP